MKQPCVTYEDNHLLIVNKPCGWLVQGDYTGDGTLVEWATDYIRKKYHKPGGVFCHPCHRLDRSVSGLTILARTSKALVRMNELFREHRVNKNYLAIVTGVPPKTEDTLMGWLKKDVRQNIARIYQKQKGNAKQVVLSYALMSSMGKHSLLLIHLKTGRFHQIRAQLKTIGCPIKGDLKYGYPKLNQDKSINLHAYKLEFIHPVKKELIKIVSKPDWKEYKPFINEMD